jgi:serralysin
LGNDTIIGGSGNDSLVGGTGKDVFVFDQKPNAKSNLDYIQDFNPPDDIVHLSRKIFSKIAKGALSSKAFVVGDHFKDKDDRILYYKQGGALFYDPDGSGSAKAIQFASLSKGLKISHKDFFVL